MRMIQTLLFLVFGLAVVVPASGDPGPFPPDPELLALKEEAMSLALIRDLGLSPEQRGDIKDILSSLRNELTATREHMFALQQQFMKPRLEEMIADMKAGKDPAPHSRESLDRLAELRRIRRDMAMRARVAMGRILNVLDPEQTQRLADFRPLEALGVPGWRRGGPEGKDALALLEEVRTASGEHFATMVGRLQARMAAPPHREGPLATEWKHARDRRLQDLVDLMQEIRSMPDEEFSASSASLQAKLDDMLPGRGHGRWHTKPGSDDRSGKFSHGKGFAHGPARGSGFMPARQRILLTDAFYQVL